MVSYGHTVLDAILSDSLTLHTGNPLPEQHVRSLTQAAATVISALLDPSIRSEAP